jgi:hypothetical protein
MMKATKIMTTVVIVMTAFIASSAFAQAGGGHKFQDDLLDRFIGKWDATLNGHGSKFTSQYEGEWVINHQFFHFYCKTNEVVPWLGAPMEYEYFIGYNHPDKRYVVHGMSVHGSDDYEGFCYASRNGNELTMVQKGTDSTKVVVQRYTYDPTSNSWLIQSRRRISGKEGDVFLEIKLTAAK